MTLALGKDLMIRSMVDSETVLHFHYGKEASILSIPSQYVVLWPSILCNEEMQYHDNLQEHYDPSTAVRYYT